MDFIQIDNLSRPEGSKIRAGYCLSFFSRFRGLMLRSNIIPNEGILLDEGADSRMNTSIHMLFMKFAISVIWINSKMIVVDRVLAYPWKIYYAPKAPARYILETHPDRLDDFQNGDLIVFKPL